MAYVWQSDASGSGVVVYLILRDAHEKRLFYETGCISGTRTAVDTPVFMRWMEILHVLDKTKHCGWREAQETRRDTLGEQ